eukprot:g13218.t1
MPKAFSHLATALACSLVARLSSTSVVVVSRVYAAQLPREERGGTGSDVPAGFHANVLGFLGKAGQGAGKVKMLSRAAKETVDAMHKHEGHPEAHPDLLRVGKLLHVMRHGDKNAVANAIRDLDESDWSSLLASATPGVAEVARVCRLLAVLMRHVAVGDEGAADNAIRALDLNSLLQSATPGVAEVARLCNLLAVMRSGDAANETIRDLDWTSLPAWAKPEVAEKAIRMHLLEPDQWKSLPIEARGNKHVVLAAIMSRLIPQDSAEAWWYSLPFDVQEMPDVVAAALASGRLGANRSPFLWTIMASRRTDSLPPSANRIGGRRTKGGRQSNHGKS